MSNMLQKRIVTYRYITNRPHHIAYCEEGIHNFPLNNNYHFKFYQVPLTFDLKKDIHILTSLYLCGKQESLNGEIKVLNIKKRL